MIRVNDDWVILISDPMNYQPARDMHMKHTVKKKDGTEIEELYYKAGYGYFSSLKGAVREIARVEYKNALTGRETALNEAIKIMDDTMRRFEKILKEIEE